jgi:hypothetical protein
MHSPSSARDAAKGNWSLLRESVRHLALTAGEQLEWIGPASIDELALDYDAFYPAAWQSRDEGWISEQLATTLGDIDQMLINLTDEGPAAWTAKALHSHPRWEELRKLAHPAMALMPAEPWNASD